MPASKKPYKTRAKRMSRAKSPVKQGKNALLQNATIGQMLKLLAVHDKPRAG
jgi:hypothetical protein